jgi:hypothetical protein
MRFCIFSFFASFLFFCSPVFAQWVEIENLPSRGIETSYKLGNVLWVGTSNGLYYSTDAGTTFKLEEGLPRGLGVMNIHEIDGVLLVFCNQLVQEQSRLILCKSPDNGVSWKIIDTGLPPCVWTRYFVIGDKIYLPSCIGSPSITEFYRSDDRGETFQFVSMQPKFSWMAGNDSVFAGITSRTMHISKDYGQTSDTVYTINNPSDALYQVFQKDSSIIVTSLLGYILKSVDWGNTWDSIHLNLGSHLIFWEDLESNQLFAGSVEGIFKSGDFGYSWEEVPLKFPHRARAMYQIENKIIVSDGSFLYSQSPDGTWENKDQGIFNCSVVELCYSDNNLLAFINGTAKISKNKGRSWKQIPIPSSNPFYGLAVKSNLIYLSNSKGLFVSKNEGNSWKQIFWGSSIRLITHNSGIYITIDHSLYEVNEENLSLINDNLPSHLRGFGRDESGYWFLNGTYGLYHLPIGSANWEYKSQIITDLVFDYAHITIIDDRLFIPAYGHVYYSDDSGATWNKSNMPLPNFSSTNPGMIVMHGGDMYLAAQSTHTGVMVSHDRGETWSFFNDNLGNTQIGSIVLADSLLFLTAKNSGLWVHPLGGSIASGKVFSDENANLIPDREEKPLANIPIIARPSNKSTMTNTSGYYFLEIPFGDTISVAPPSPHHEVDPNFVVASKTVLNQDFAVRLSDTTGDLCIFISPTSGGNELLREIKFRIVVTNSGTALMNSPKLVLHLSRNWKFYKANLSPANIEMDSVRWELSHMAPGESISIQVEAIVTNIKAGQSEWIFARVYSNQNDVYPFNNTFVREYHPDFTSSLFSKEVYPATTLSPQYTALNQHLEYTIIFDYPQTNDQEFTIVDTLSPHLDLTTFSLIFSDVPCKWEILDGRVVQFTFTTNGIPKRQQVIRFSIMPQTGLPLGVVIENTAFLTQFQTPPRSSNPTYVEINYPWPTWNPLGNPVKLQCYPNPASNFSVITWAEPLQQDGFLQIFNSTGQLQVTHHLRYGLSQYRISLEMFSNGPYFIHIITERERYTGKLIVE